MDNNTTKTWTLMSFVSIHGVPVMRTFGSHGKSLVCQNKQTGIETIVSPPNPANGKSLSFEFTAANILSRRKELSVIETVSKQGNIGYVLFENADEVIGCADDWSE